MPARWLLLLVLLVAACKSKAPEPIPDPPKVAAPAPPPAPVLPKPAPLSEASVLYLETRERLCAWVEEDPLAGTKRDLLVLEADCHELHWALDPGLSEGLVWRRPGEEASELIRLDLATLQREPRPSPPGSVASLGYAKDGTLVALVRQPDRDGKMEKATVDGAKFFVFEGQQYPLVDDGVPGLAHAFRLQGKAWTRFETKATIYDVDYAAGVEALVAAQGLGPRGPSFGYQNTAYRSLREEQPERALLEKALPHGEDEAGEWGIVQTASITLYDWAETSEVISPTAQLYTLVGSRPQLFALPVDQEASIDLQARGPYLLVSSVESETWLYRLPSHEPIATWKGAYGICFRPVRPSL